MLRKVKMLACAVSLILAGYGVAQADSIYVANASFESPDASSSPYVLFTADNWTVTYSAGVVYNNVAGNNSVITNADGSQMGWLASDSAWGSGAFGGLHQELASNYALGMSYTLTVGVAARLFQDRTVDPADKMEIQLTWRDEYGVDQVINAQPISWGDLSTSNLTDYTVTIPVVQASDPFYDKPIGISLKATYQEYGTSNLVWIVDNVRLTATPEPSSIALVVSALIGLLAYAWRKRK